jgi:hypothetical protein
MPETNDVAGLIDRLTAIHGEEGVCPTAGDWRAIFAVGGSGPVHILNRSHPIAALRPGAATSRGNLLLDLDAKGDPTFVGAFHDALLGRFARFKRALLIL